MYCPLHIAEGDAFCRITTISRRRLEPIIRRQERRFFYLLEPIKCRLSRYLPFETDWNGDRTAIFYRRLPIKCRLLRSLPFETDWNGDRAAIFYRRLPIKCRFPM